MPPPRNKNAKRRPAPAQRKPSRQETVAEQATAEQAGEPEPNGKSKHFVQPYVLEHIRGNNGEPVTLKDLTDLIGCPEGSIQHAALRLARTVPQIEVITKGQVWRWNKNATDNLAELLLSEPEPEFAAEEAADVWYVQVGRNSVGEPILRLDGSSELFRAVPL